MSTQPHVSPEFPHYDPENDEKWWNQLPDWFSSHREQFTIDPMNYLKIQAISASDYVFRTYASMAVVLSNARMFAKLLDKEHRDQWEFYRQEQFFD